MSRKQDKTAKRKAKLKARRVQAKVPPPAARPHRRCAHGSVCRCSAGVCRRFQGIDLVGRNILWRMGMVAWNIAVTGRREIDESSINTMKLDEESRRDVRDEFNALVRLKYKKYPDSPDLHFKCIRCQCRRSCKAESCSPAIHSRRCSFLILPMNPDFLHRNNFLPNARHWDSRRLSLPPRSTFP